MIYITNKYSDDYNHIQNVWQVDVDNAEELYLKFMIDKSIEMNIIVNPHWLNIMDYTKCNSHLTKNDYNILSKKWKKFLHSWNLDRYIFEKLHGTKLDFKTSNK